MAVAVEGDLAGLLLGDAGIALLDEAHLGPLHPLEEALEADELLAHRLLQRVRYIDVAAANGDLHEVPFRLWDECRALLRCRTAMERGGRRSSGPAPRPLHRPCTSARKPGGCVPAKRLRRGCPARPSPRRW